MQFAVYGSEFDMKADPSGRSHVQNSNIHHIKNIIYLFVYALTYFQSQALLESLEKMGRIWWRIDKC